MVGFSNFSRALIRFFQFLATFPCTSDPNSKREIWIFLANWFIARGLS